MKIEYQGKKWDKEVANFQKFKKSVKGNFNDNEIYVMNEFLKTGNTDFLRLYNHLAGVYERMAVYYYLDDINSKEIKKYTYLSGIALLISECLYQKGVRTEYNEIVENSIRQKKDYALFQLIAVEKLELPYVNLEENNVILLMYYQKYEQAKHIIDLLPDETDDLSEIYYIRPEFLKKIYMAIIEHDEKKFNEELAKRIKKYRKNMVGYSTIIDVVSVALIKMAERAGIHSVLDVIEIPKQFFDNACESYKDVKLPYYDEFVSIKLL